MASEDVGHSKRDDDLQFTRLQEDHAHIYIRVVEVAARDTPPTLRNRRFRCQGPGQPHISLIDRCIADIVLCQDLSNEYHDVGARTAVCGAQPMRGQARS
jgi:hypothetical protein